MSKEQEKNNFFRSKKVLITGGLGFIGSNLARRLLKLRCKVTILDSLIPKSGGNLFNINGIEQMVKLKIGDIRDNRIINHLVKDKDVIFNLAGVLSHIESMKDPYRDLDINSRGQLSILESCRKYNPGVKIIFAGTRSQYGRPKYLPVDENHPMDPADINGINKLTAESYHLLYNKVYNIHSVSLRLTNTYGPRHQMKYPDQGIIGWFVRLILDSQDIQLFGDGKQIRDCNYIDDVIEAFILAGISPQSIGQAYNLGGSPISLLDIVKLLIRITGKGSYRFVGFPDDRRILEVGDYIADYSKIKKHLGWKPKFSIEEGLKNTVEFYKINKGHYW